MYSIEKGLISAILFDFGGTLDSDGIPWADRFHQVYLRHGLEIDFERFRKAFYFADDTIIEGSLVQGKGLLETLEIQTGLLFGHLGVDDRRLQGEIAGAFYRESVSKVDENRGTLERLASKYRLGLVSNFYGNLEEVCEELHLTEILDVAIDSTVVGVMKPDAGIFQAALNPLGLEPGQALFVGDNPYRDMGGAKAIGMPHVWVVGPEGLARTPCCPGDPVVASVREIEEMLKVNSSG